MCKQHLLDVLWSYTDAYDRYTSAWAENRDTEQGRSPRTRGRPEMETRTRCRCRSIPAYAG